MSGIIYTVNLYSKSLREIALRAAGGPKCIHILPHICNKDIEKLCI